MSMVNVPSLAPGVRSLPAELLTRGARGRDFARNRLANSLAGLGVGGVGVGMGAAGDCLQWDTDSEGNVTCTETETGSGGFAVSGPDLPSTAINTPTEQAIAAIEATGRAGPAPVGYAGPRVVAANASTPAAPTGYQWATILNASGQGLAKILAVSQGGSSVTLPNGTQLVYGSPASSIGGTNTGLLSAGGVTGLFSSPIVLMGVAALVLFSVMGNRR